MDPSVRFNRLLMAIGGAAYLLWWFSVELLLPGSYNPLGSRLLVVLYCWAIWAGSFRFPLISRNMPAWLLSCLFLITAHYYYLFYRNQADINWVVGSYITVVAASACLQTEAAFLGYSIGVLLLSVALALLNRALLDTIFLPGIFTILAFAYIGLRSRLRLLKALGLQNLELQALNKELESFSFSVSHDLRAPLRSAAGFAQILLEDHADKLQGEARDSLHRIVDAAQRMGRLIDGLIGLSRLTRQELSRAPLDLSRMAREIVQELRSADPGRSVEVVIAGNVAARGDPQLVRSALTNILSNSWKFTAAKGDARIEFGATTQGRETVYFVRDNGAGFDMNYSSKLFGAFQRLHTQQEFEGTGIGLATVRRIVERHGGRVWAEARVNEGATFYFTL